ncbi:type II secretion system major pseudopilin GspG [Elongatibacter sediminis]|uniref:Type II secretion system core protein G n=1 Tax=Elongatibacter sediminis TaxID=3119006 RepID=A0AAW9RFM0_9GAMM
MLKKGMNLKQTMRPARHAIPGKRTRGFTLVELLLVLVILALIGGLVLPGIIGKAESAKIKAASSQVSRLSMAVESYYLDTGTTPENLEHLVDDPGEDGWNGPYVKESSLKDPWGREYEYRLPGEHGEFDIISYGADGQPGGEDNNADINSWE